MATEPIYLNTHLDDYNGDCTAAMIVDVHLVSQSASAAPVQVSAQMIAAANGKPAFVRIWDAQANPNPPAMPSFSEIIAADDARKFRVIKAFYNANGIAVPTKSKSARKKSAAKKSAPKPKGRLAEKPKK